MEQAHKALRARHIRRERRVPAPRGRNAHATRKNVHARSAACMSNLHAVCIEPDLDVHAHRARCLCA